MQAIILAAGEGSRMRPLTSKRPKVMLPVCGKPILEQIVLRAKQAGVESFVFVVGYGADVIKLHFGDGSNLGVRIDYAVQDRQLGTGHALLAAEATAEDRFVVLNGDVLPDAESLKSMTSIEGNAVAAGRVPDPSRYGVFLEDGGYMKSVIEKSKTPPSDLANAGIYLFDREIFDALKKTGMSQRGEYELTDGLNALASKDEMKIKIIELKDWIEVGRPWDILTANEKLMPDVRAHIEGEIEHGATLKGIVSVGRGTVVRTGSYIVGPVVIDEDCDIGPNCYIRPYTCLGKNVRVGNGVEIKNSAIMDGTKIGHLSYVGDSVIGSGCNFGAGTIASNLRHDNANIKSYIKGLPVDSGRRKLGVIMGDDVKTGIHTTIYPGTVIESGHRSMPAAELRGMVCAAVKGECKLIF
jgi:UDP-N-acetylglucosamine diphosphorylase / glucose-1-phosphate thymidylyltransferase / UDP-N-acetylgalactosamine diphosphorylase / glucosamine-1-phosphate N-acetyltransferase / galactosamine-1-phosphate N-acetyltransferase